MILDRPQRAFLTRALEGTAFVGGDEMTAVGDLLFRGLIEPITTFEYYIPKRNEQAIREALADDNTG